MTLKAVCLLAGTRIEKWCDDQMRSQRGSRAPTISSQVPGNEFAGLCVWQVPGEAVASPALSMRV